MWISPRRSGRRDARFTLCRAEPYSGHAAFHPFALAGDYRRGICGPHLSHAMFAVWLALLPRMVRSVYSMVHDELEKEYVIAARLDGATTLNILWFAILPNITAGLVTEITRALSMAILDIAALGFLDLGAQLPSPEWGAMLGDALELIYVAPWTVMLPGAAITLSVLLVNLLGDGIRRAIIAGVE